MIMVKNMLLHLHVKCFISGALKPLLYSVAAETIECSLVKQMPSYIQW